MEPATTRETASHTFGWLENQQISMLHMLNLPAHTHVNWAKPLPDLT